MGVSRLDNPKLLDAATTGAANGNGQTFDIPINGLVTVYVSGTFGGGNVQIQVSPDHGVTWMNLGAALSSTTSVTSTIVATAIRAIVAGATAPALNCYAVLVDYGG
jgi:hypothetical protein